MSTSKTYYDLLGVSTDASEEEIQQAYRDLVRETHPDVNDDPNAREQMVELTKARDILTDAQKRAEYDAAQNIDGRQTQETTHTTRETASTTSQTQHRNQNRSHHRHSNQHHHRRQTSQGGGRTSETGAQGTASAQSHSRQERRGRSHTRTRTRTRSQTSHTTAESSSLGSMPLRVRLRYLYHQRGRLFREGCRRLVVFLFNLCTVHFLWGLDRERIYSFLTTPTVLRLAATFGLWWVIDLGLRQLDRSMMFGEGQVLLVGLCLFGSYLGHDILSGYTDWVDVPFAKQARSTEEIRVWPILGTNLLALGLFFWALSAGAPAGGIGLAFVTVLLFLILTPIFSVIAFAVVFAIGANVSRTLLERGTFLGPTSGLLLSLGALFTPAFFPGGVSHALKGLPVSTHPWISSQLVGQAGPVYLGLVINALFGGLMLGSLFWSLLTTYRNLTRVAWRDRLDRGYHIRPGFWNFLVTLPFVLLGWMLIQHISIVSLSIGSGVTLFTLGELVGLFGILPIVLLCFYLFRRRIEPWVQNIL